MVLPSLFAKSSKKHRPTPHNGSDTPPASPDKQSHSKVRDRERSSRRSSSYSSKRSSKYDHDSHPLNLPPEERQRLSFQMSAAMDQPTPQPMDVDREHSSSPAPSPSCRGGDR